MLNPQMKGWGYYEWMRRQMQALKEQRKPQPPKTNWAPGARSNGRPSRKKRERPKSRLLRWSEPVLHSDRDREFESAFLHQRV
jgi:hypothetical protein